MASANASPAERKAYLENPAVASATATRSVSTHLAETVARKDSRTGRTQRSKSLVGDAHSASSNNRRGVWKELVLPLTFCDVVNSCSRTGHAAVLSGTSNQLKPPWNCLRHCTDATGDSTPRQQKNINAAIQSNILF